MINITNSSDLSIAIQQLELKQDKEWALLKEQFQSTLGKFKLSNIVKGTIKDIITGPGLRTMMLQGVMGIATGVIAKNMLGGKTVSPFKRLLGNIFR